MTETDFRRQALRAAARIHEHLVGPAYFGGIGRLPDAGWQDAQQTADRLDLVCRRGWRKARESLLVDLDYQARRVVRELEDFLRSLPTRLESVSIAKPGDIAADLLALDGEFDDVEIDLRGKSISAVTPPITLERLDLGSFSIVLRWERIGRARAYDVEAKNPYHPEGDEEVTHPHVRNDTLCEGDGANSIKAALRGGRLLDFFLLVRQILDTYNPASPYVAIDRWHGHSCTDCGDRMSSDESGSCEQCEVSLCGGCSRWCRGCDTYVCGECIGSCSECGDRYCSACLETPAGATTRLCQSCLEKQNDAEDAQDDAAAQADPVCLGQTAVAA